MDELVKPFMDDGWEVKTTLVNPEDYGINQDQIQVDKVKETKNPNDGQSQDLSEFMIEVVRVIAAHYYVAVILL